MSKIRVLRLSDQATAQAVLALQISAYGREAEIIGSPRIPALHETLADVSGSDETAWGMYVHEQLVGCITYMCVGQVLEICKMMVRPNLFRTGIGSRLLTDVFEHEAWTTRAHVSTAAKNYPAIQFYLHEGFKEIGRQLTHDGIELVHFQKDLIRVYRR
jgi:GNAT superfamily N-acetyltransferase